MLKFSPFVGQLHGPVRTGKQLNLQAFLQVANLLADGGLRQVQLFGRAGKAQQARGGFERNQRIERGQA